MMLRRNTAGMNLLKLFDADLGIDRRGVEFSLFIPSQRLCAPLSPSLDNNLATFHTDIFSIVHKTKETNAFVQKTRNLILYAKIKNRPVHEKSRSLWLNPRVRSSK